MNFIAMDFETANAQRHSACSLALVMVQNSQIVGKYYTLIRPETTFHWRNIQVHGIEEKDIYCAPKFPDVWKQISEYFQPHHLIVAHNAAFDCSVLRGCLTYYNLEQPHYLSLCTVKTSKKLFPQFANHQLNTVCTELDIPLLNHHDALEDSLACANILLQQEKLFGTAPLKKMVVPK